MTNSKELVSLAALKSLKTIECPTVTLKIPFKGTTDQFKEVTKLMGDNIFITRYNPAKNNNVKPGGEVLALNILNAERKDENIIVVKMYMGCMYDSGMEDLYAKAKDKINNILTEHVSDLVDKENIEVIEPGLPTRAFAYWLLGDVVRGCRANKKDHFFVRRYSEMKEEINTDDIFEELKQRFS